MTRGRPDIQLNPHRFSPRDTRWEVKVREELLWAEVKSDGVRETRGDTVVCKEGASGAAARTERDVGRSSVSWGPRRGAAESERHIHLLSASPRPWRLSFTFLQSSSPCGTVLWGSPRITSSSRERTGFVGFPWASNSAQHIGISKEIPPGMNGGSRSVLPQLSRRSPRLPPPPPQTPPLLPRLRPSPPPPPPRLPPPASTAALPSRDPVTSA